MEAPQACPLYCGRLIRAISLDVPTPLWMVRRLERSGLRTVNSVVDVTNYVMLETGQPLHAFDLAKISGTSRASIHIRYARAGEALRVRNEEDVDLRPDMLVIADAPLLGHGFAFDRIIDPSLWEGLPEHYAELSAQERVSCVERLAGAGVVRALGEEQGPHPLSARHRPLHELAAVVF